MCTMTPNTMIKATVNIPDKSLLCKKIVSAINSLFRCQFVGDKQRCCDIMVQGTRLWNSGCPCLIQHLSLCGLRYSFGDQSVKRVLTFISRNLDILRVRGIMTWFHVWALSVKLLMFIMKQVNKINLTMFSVGRLYCKVICNEFHEYFELIHIDLAFYLLT